MTFKIEDMFPEDLDNYLASENAVAVLGVGSNEQHGPHLLLGCDSYIARGLSECTAEACEGLMFPIIPHCWIGGLRVWPGTIDIRSRNMGDYLEEVCMSILNMGFKKLIILDCHGGGREMAYSVASRIFNKTGIPVLSVYASNLYSAFPELLDIYESHGIKRDDGSAFEASNMLGGLKKLGKTELLAKVEELTKQAIEEFGEVDTKVQPSYLLSKLLVGHYYLEETTHISPRSSASAEAGLAVLEAMGRKLETTAKQLDEFCKQLNI